MKPKCNKCGAQINSFGFCSRLHVDHEHHPEEFNKFTTPRTIKKDDEIATLRAEVETWKRVCAAVMVAFRPVLDWYQPDDQPARRLDELIADAVADLVDDRVEVERLRSTLQDLIDQIEAERPAIDAPGGRSLRVQIEASRAILAGRGPGKVTP